MKITKAASVELSGAPSAEQLEKINRLTKKAVTAEEVYVFSVRLCDDQVDRDDERFSEACIRELAALFVGKTGIMDHAWSAEKQVARIFDTEVLAENGATYLKGWAYMLRGAETDGLIREIDGGIKKEVSIGCAVKRRMCSICGAEYGACEHVKGETYGAEPLRGSFVRGGGRLRVFVCGSAGTEAGGRFAEADGRRRTGGRVCAEKAAEGGGAWKGLPAGAGDAGDARGAAAGTGTGCGTDEADCARHGGGGAERAERGSGAPDGGAFAPEPQMTVEQDAAREQNSAFLI